MVMWWGVCGACGVGGMWRGVGGMWRGVGGYVKRGRWVCGEG